MGKSQESFNKKEKEKKRLKKRQDKQLKKDERRKNSPGGGIENMLAYVDENGMVTDTPPDPSRKKSVTASTIEIGVPKRTEEKNDGFHKGRVEFFDESKGFGFIKDAETQDKYFVHVSSLNEEIMENDVVTFKLERGMKGMNAVQVRKI